MSSRHEKRAFLSGWERKAYKQIDLDTKPQMQSRIALRNIAIAAGRVGWLHGIYAFAECALNNAGNFRRFPFQTLFEIAAFRGDMKMLKFLEAISARYRILSVVDPRKKPSKIVEVDYFEVLKCAADGGQRQTMLFAIHRLQMFGRYTPKIDPECLDNIIYRAGCSGELPAIRIAVGLATRVKRDIFAFTSKVDICTDKQRNIWHAMIGAAASGHTRLAKKLYTLAPIPKRKKNQNMRELIMCTAEGGSVKLMHFAKKRIMEVLGKNGDFTVFANCALARAAASGKIRCMQLAVRWGARDFEQATRWVIYEKRFGKMPKKAVNYVGIVNMLKGMAIQNGIFVGAEFA